LLHAGDRPPEHTIARRLRLRPKDPGAAPAAIDGGLPEPPALLLLIERRRYDRLRAVLGVEGLAAALDEDDGSAG